MKKGFYSIHRILIAASTVVLAGLLFTACKKDSGINNDIPVAGLMAFNLTPDKSAVGVALSGNLLINSPLGYTNYTGGYLNIYPGERSVQSYDFSKDSILVASSFNFETNKYYSLFVTGNNGAYKNVVVKDNFDSLSSTSGQSYIRYVNAIPDSSAPAVSIRANGNNIVSGPAAFGVVSDFKAVNSSDLNDVNITVANGNTISANRKITLENGKVYTVLLVGVPAAADTAKTVQIKFVQNGTLSN